MRTGGGRRAVAPTSPGYDGRVSDAPGDTFMDLLGIQDLTGEDDVPATFAVLHR